MLAGMQEVIAALVWAACSTDFFPVRLLRFGMSQLFEILLPFLLHS
jgi:hypothetical protein